MLSDRDRLFAGAIVLGFSIVGLAVYLGLTQGRAPVQPQPASPELRSTASVGVAPPSPSSSPSPPPLPPRNVVDDNVRAALDAQKRDVLIPKCWLPLPAKEREQGSVYTLSLSFGPDGQELGRGISELRGTVSRADVAECLRRLPLSLHIPPPGTAVQAEVPLQFP